jgi:hypothetical protein
MNSLVLCALLLFSSQERPAQDEQEAEDPVVAPHHRQGPAWIELQLAKHDTDGDESFRLRRCHRNGISFAAINYRFTNVANLLDYFARQFAKQASESD